MSGFTLPNTRYRERSLPPLASMDERGRVIYMGTFSKSLSPALRINYLVLPEPLLAQWREAFAASYSPVPWLNQKVLARFMTDGSWDRHVRRVQAKNRRKYTALLAALEETMGDKIEVMEKAPGCTCSCACPTAEGRTSSSPRPPQPTWRCTPRASTVPTPTITRIPWCSSGSPPSPRRTSAPASRPWPAPGSGRDRKAVIESLYGKSTDIPFETLRYAPCVIFVRADTDGVQSRRP